jgi:hypothetical protein
MDLTIRGLNPGVEVFLYFKTFGQALGPTQPPIQSLPSFFLGVKGSECEVEQLSPNNSEVKLVDLYLYFPYTPS